MGVLFTDKFSLLHFASGVIIYYWNISFMTWFILHAIYEFVENTRTGMGFINKVTLWPGGKPAPDTLLNRVGDQFYAMCGWIFAHYFIILLYGKYN